MATASTRARSSLVRLAGLASLGLFGLALASASACSGAAAENGAEKTGGAGGNNASGAGSGSAGDTGSLGIGAGPGSGSGSTGTGFEECATSAQEATVVPLNMILMFDRSGSMEDDNKWDNATEALKAFVQDPGSAGLRIALRFFPANGCNDSSCDIDTCSVPAIEAAPLTAESAPADTHEGDLISAIDGEDPNGNGTPIYAALGGAEKWAKDFLAATPNEKAIVILVTDGLPNGCDEDTDDIAALATDGLAQGVLTYSVGLEGSSEGLMNLIAEEGGTGEAFFIGSGNAKDELLEALKAIQGSQVACEFQMPESQNGQAIDPAQINVTYTSSGASKTIGQVAAQSDCTDDKGGWYYDDPASPTTITLCSSTCQIVQADAAAKIDIVVGCATKPVE